MSSYKLFLIIFFFKVKSINHVFSLLCLNLKFWSNAHLLRQSRAQDVRLKERPLVRFVRLRNGRFVGGRLQVRRQIHAMFADAAAGVSIVLDTQIGNVDDLRILSVLVVPILKDQRHARHSNAYENHDEHATNVLDRDAVRLVLGLRTTTLELFVLPPIFF